MRTSNVDQMISKHAFQISFSSSSRILDLSSSDFHQVHKFSIQMQFFDIYHTDERFFLYVNVCMWNRHRDVIVSIIKRSAWIRSNQIKSTWIRSDQIRSAWIRSNEIRSICSHRLMTLWERQSRFVLYEMISIKSL